MTGPKRPTSQYDRGTNARHLIFQPDALARVTEAAVRRQYERLLLSQPHLPAKGLWQVGGEFMVLVPEGFDLQTFVTLEGEPLSVWLTENRDFFGKTPKFLSQLPEGACAVPIRDAKALARLEGESRTLGDLYHDFALLLPKDFPEYLLAEDLSSSPRRAVIYTSTALTDEQRDQAIAVWQTLESVLMPDFVVGIPISENAEKPRQRQGEMALIASRNLSPSFGLDAKWALEEDEDFWLSIRERLLGEDSVGISDVLPSDMRSSVSRCALALSPGAPPNPRIFLPIYEQLLIGLPLNVRLDEFLAAQKLTIDDCVKLALCNRLRFLAPYSPDRYPPEFVSRLTAEAPGSIIWPRRLAAAMVLDTRRRMPLFYPAASIAERRSALSTLWQLASTVDKNSPQGQWLSCLREEIHEHWGASERLLHRLGASAVLIDGLGSFVARLVKTYQGRELGLEMRSAGATVQWASAFNATIIPQTYSDYSEDKAVELCADIYSGVPRSKILPEGDMASVIEGILCIDNDAPILEVAEAFSGVDVARVRTLVSEIARSNQDPDYLRDTIAKFNSEVKRYERNAAKLAKLNVVGGLAALTGLTLGSVSPPLAATLWGIGLMLNGPDLRGRTGQLLDTVRGATSWVSPGVVLVSRLKKGLQQRL